MPISPSSLNGYEFNSNAEKIIYLEASKSGYFNNSEKYLFHSLNIMNTGGMKVKSEIDFVYLDNDCILFFEVKGGEVKFNSLTNEWWVQGGTNKRDPFKQAYDGLFQLRDNLLPQLFNGLSIPRRLAYGIGVLFPESIMPNEFRKSTAGQMEYDPILIYDYNDHKKNGLIPFIEKTKNYWSSHPQFSKRTGISSREVSTISRYFRQDLHLKLPVSDLLRKGDHETARFTRMQMYVLDNLNFNVGKGGIIMGGPGTGKTILAIELLRRKLEEDKKTLFVCYNKNLSDHINNQCKNLNFKGQFEIHNIHHLYRDENYLMGDVDPIRESPEYWSQDLPLSFVRNLSENKKGQFEFIIIDEGQDILNEYHFDALGKLLKGGLESGNWTIFMDKDYQNIYNSDADEYLGYLSDVYPCFVNLLQLNCRNTLSTVKRASVETGFPEMACLRTDEAWKSEIKYYSSEPDLKNRINDLIINMLNDGIEKKHITILCSDRSQLTDLIGSNPSRYIESAFAIDGKINLSTIHAYKGLENKFILICGPKNFDPNDKIQMSLIFIANTRATAQSIFFLDRRFEHIIINRISEIS